MADTELKAKRELIQILDDVLAEGVWTGSLFLEASGKKIKALRDRLVQDFNLEQGNNNVIEQTSATNTQTKDNVLVYIALYQATGLNIKKWESMLNAIGNFSAGRPIYRNEEDVQAFIRAKESAQNDGYAAIYINQKDILAMPSNKQLLDRSGKELVMVKDGAIKSENIIYFVHSTGQYTLKSGILIKDNP